MATEATFTVPSDQFPLGSIFEPFPGVTVELERIIPGTDYLTPYFWVRGIEIDDIEAQFTDHPGVTNIRLIDSVNEQYLLRVEWATSYDGILSTLAETEVPLINAEGTHEQWTFDIRGDDQSDIAAFQRRCRELDIPITLKKLHALTPLDSGVKSNLTESQQEALMLAYERGYFESPRKVTMSDLGEELGISQQAVASRLRRGLKHILRNMLA